MTDIYAYYNKYITAISFLDESDFHLREKFYEPLEKTLPKRLKIMQSAPRKCGTLYDQWKQWHEENLCRLLDNKITD